MSVELLEVISVSENEFPEKVDPKIIGDELRTAREKKGYTLDDIQKIIKLRSKYLEAIEAGEFSVFPGSVYAKGAIKNYADLVDCDHEKLWNLFDQVYEQSQKEDKDTTRQKKDRGAAPTSSMSLPSLDKVLSAIVKLVAIIAIISVLGYGGYLGMNLIGDIMDDWETAEEEMEREEPEEDIDPVEEEEEEDTDEEETPETSVELVSESPLTYEVTGVDQLEVVLTIDQRTWVGVGVDGESREDYGNMEPGTEETFSADSQLDFRFGYAVGAKLTIDGVDIPVPETEGSENVILQRKEDQNDE